MADNRHIMGFRWVGSLSGRDRPILQEFVVADSAAWNDDAAAACAVNIGDPVELVNDGSVIISAGGDSSGILGVVHSIVSYWDGSKLVTNDFVPAATTGGAVEDRYTRVLISLASDSIYEIDTSTAAQSTKNAYRGLIGNNCDHINTRVSFNGRYWADSKLVASGAGTGTAQWRIVGISPTQENVDFSGNYVKLLVTANESYFGNVASTTGV